MELDCSDEGLDGGVVSWSSQTPKLSWRRRARIPVKDTGGSSYHRLKNTGGSQDTHGTHGAHGTDDARRFGSSGVPSNWAPWGIQLQSV